MATSNNSTSQYKPKSMGEAVAYHGMAAFFKMLTGIVGLCLKWIVTALWMVALFVSFSSTESPLAGPIVATLFTVALLWRPLSERFGFFYLEAVDYIRPFFADTQRQGSLKGNLSLRKIAYNWYVGAGFIKDGDEKAPPVPNRCVRNDDGSVTLVLENVFPQSGTLENNATLLSSRNAADYMGVEYIQVKRNPQGAYLLSMMGDVDATSAQGNRLLRDLNVVKGDDAGYYAVEYFDETQGFSNPVFVLCEKQIGPKTSLEIEKDLEKIAVKIGAHYAEALDPQEFSKKYPAEANFIDFPALMVEHNATAQEAKMWRVVTLVKDMDANQMEANTLLKNMGVLGANDFISATIEPIKDSNGRHVEDRLILWEMPQGKNIAGLLNATSGWESSRGAFTVKMGKLHDDGKMLYTLAEQESSDPAVRTAYTNATNVLRFIISSFLDDPTKTFKEYKKELPKINPENMSAICAINEAGEELPIVFKGTAGMLVAGMPGSGKTAGITSFGMSFALSDYVEYNIVDCKGGDDWTSYASIANTFVSGADHDVDEDNPVSDLMRIHELLTGAVRDMNDRVATNKKKLGQSNFWNASAQVRRNAGVPFKLIVIDECQEIFRTASRGDREEAQLLEEIKVAATRLVKKGRSAGICVIFITQIPTVDSIPSGIRGNCGQRLSFRLSSASTVQIVFGDAVLDPSFPSPMSIPKSRAGGAVLGLDNGKVEEVRFFYTPEDRVEEILKGSDKFKKRLAAGLIDDEGNPIRKDPPAPPKAPTLEEAANTPMRPGRAGREGLPSRATARPLRGATGTLERPKRERPKLEDRKITPRPRMKRPKFLDESLEKPKVEIKSNMTDAEVVVITQEPQEDVFKRIASLDPTTATGLLSKMSDNERKSYAAYLLTPKGLEADEEKKQREEEREARRASREELAEIDRLLEDDEAFDALAREHGESLESVNEEAQDRVETLKRALDKAKASKDEKEGGDNSPEEPEEGTQEATGESEALPVEESPQEATEDAQEASEEKDELDDIIAQGDEGLQEVAREEVE